MTDHRLSRRAVLATTISAILLPGLIGLGRFEAGTEALHVRGTYSLTIEAI